MQLSLRQAGRPAALTADHRLNPAALLQPQRGLHFARVHCEGVVVVMQVVVVVVMVWMMGHGLVGRAVTQSGGGGRSGGRGEGLPEDGDGVGVGEEDVAAAAERLRISLAG